MKKAQIAAWACVVPLYGVASAAGMSVADAQRTQAVNQTIASARECRKLGDFYWEIGDAQHAVASGSVGARFTADRTIRIASASKWVFGSYVLEKIGRNVEPGDDQIRALEMLSGYTSLKFGACVFSRTVEDCFRHRGNDEFTSSAVGKFSYNGAHDQKLAVDLGLGGLTSAQFGEEIGKYLGRDLDIGFNTPQPAGGMKASPGAYGKFLRKILSGELRMGKYLGSHPVCTLPGRCAEAIESPVPSAWHYSLNHWIEDDPESGDGSFSSPGAFGFYPWISADRRWYGILARESYQPLAYRESVYCGAKLRKAWLTGAAQP